jgi:hypothetical protein
VTDLTGATVQLASLGDAETVIRNAVEVKLQSADSDAAALPNLKGFGTLTDLHVAMTLDPGLIDTVNANLSNLNSPDLATLRNAAMPILTAWAAAVPLRDADGVWHPATHARSCKKMIQFAQEV